MMRLGKLRFFAALSALFVAFTLVSVDFAEARRGGSFGSRGSRTYSAPAPTRTAPNQTAPVERSMTPNTGPTRQNPAVTPVAGQRSGGLFSGGLMRGLLLGGLLGALLGYGFGGAAGMLSFLFQLLVFGFLAYLLMGFLRRRQQPATASGPQPVGGGLDFGRNNMNRDSAQPENRAGSFSIPSIGAGAPAQPQTSDITVDQTDLDTFERRLGEVQRAFSDEDHAELRRISTPEMVSFFSEELAENAKRGLRNDVSDVHLVEADISEAWNEGDEDYATAAFRYESTDVMRDRNSGAIVEGTDRPTETVELWTFVRRRGGEWKLSAIQEA